MTKISIVVPSYEYRGKGGEALTHLFETLAIQTFTDFDVLVSDHSLPENKDVKNVCEKWNRDLDIKWLQNDVDRGNPASNFNYAMAKSTGEYIKFLCQDDFLFDSHSLMKTIDAFEKNPKAIWLASAYYHAVDKRSSRRDLHIPTLNDKLYIINTIGSPSCITVKNLRYELPLFDNNISYCFDCDWYYRLRASFGDPILLNDPTVVNFLWDESITSRVTPLLINKENRYILKKYGFIN